MTTVEKPYNKQICGNIVVNVDWLNIVLISDLNVAILNILIYELLTESGEFSSFTPPTTSYWIY